MPVESIEDFLKRMKQRRVKDDNPGTILTKQELEKLAGYVGREITLIIGSYEWESDTWNKPTTERKDIILEGILGYERGDDCVFTHLVGQQTEDNKQTEVLYVLTAWHDIIEKLESGTETIFHNAHLTFYYRTKNWAPAPGIYDKGKHFHADSVKINEQQRKGQVNQFLEPTFLEYNDDMLKQNDLDGNDIIILAGWHA